MQNRPQHPRKMNYGYEKKSKRIQPYQWIGNREVDCNYSDKIPLSPHFSQMTDHENVFLNMSVASSKTAKRWKHVAPRVSVGYRK